MPKAASASTSSTSKTNSKTKSRRPLETKLKTVDAGSFVGVHGLRGELKFAATRAGGDALAAGLRLTAQLRDGTARDVVVAAVRLHQSRPLVRLADVEDATAATAFVGALLRVARDDVPVREGEYFDDDLAGCMLVDTAGTPLGTVIAVAHFPASDMLVVGPQRALVPLVQAFIRTVDVPAKRIVVDLPEGLLDDAPAEIDRA